jgi:hypothetical protein
MGRAFAFMGACVIRATNAARDCGRVRWRVNNPSGPAPPTAQGGAASFAPVCAASKGLRTRFDERGWNGALAIGPKLPRPSSTTKPATDCASQQSRRHRFVREDRGVILVWPYTAAPPPARSWNIHVPLGLIGRRAAVSGRTTSKRESHADSCCLDCCDDDALCCRHVGACRSKLGWSICSKRRLLRGRGVLRQLARQQDREDSQAGEVAIDACPHAIACPRSVGAGSRPRIASVNSRASRHVRFSNRPFGVKHLF